MGSLILGLFKKEKRLSLYQDNYTKIVEAYKNNKLSESQYHALLKNNDIMLKKLNNVCIFRLVEDNNIEIWFIKVIYQSDYSYIRKPDQLINGQARDKIEYLKLNKFNDFISISEAKFKFNLGSFTYDHYINNCDKFNSIISIFGDINRINEIKEYISVNGNLWELVDINEFINIEKKLDELNSFNELGIEDD